MNFLIKSLGCDEWIETPYGPKQIKDLDERELVFEKSGTLAKIYKDPSIKQEKVYTFDLGWYKFNVSEKGNIYVYADNEFRTVSGRWLVENYKNGVKLPLALTPKYDKIPNQSIVLDEKWRNGGPKEQPLTDGAILLLSKAFRYVRTARDEYERNNRFRYKHPLGCDAHSNQLIKIKGIMEQEFKISSNWDKKRQDNGREALRIPWREWTNVGYEEPDERAGRLTNMIHIAMEGYDNNKIPKIIFQASTSQKWKFLSELFETSCFHGKNKASEGRSNWITFLIPDDEQVIHHTKALFSANGIYLSKPYPLSNVDFDTAWERAFTDNCGYDAAARYCSDFRTKTPNKKNLIALKFTRVQDTKILFSNANDLNVDIKSWNLSYDEERYQTEMNYRVDGFNLIPLDSKDSNTRISFETREVCDLEIENFKTINMFGFIFSA